MYFDDGNLFDGKLRAFQEKAKALIVASNKIGITVNVDKL